VMRDRCRPGVDPHRQTGHNGRMSTPNRRSASARVLVVDDDPQVLELLSFMLDTAGYGVLRADSGEECVRVARAELPEVILLDVQLPGMDGNATAAVLARDEKTRNIPIVMVTGLMENADRIRALQAGAVDFLSKPLSAQELVAKVGSLARLKAYHDEAQSQRKELLAEVAGQAGRLEAALDAFSRFVPREFLTCLSKRSIVEVSLGDQVQADMSILFADIRSFTTLSEKMTPRENFSFLNSYLGRMNPYIWENGGYIDKYVGDGIMALFPTEPGAALDAAIAMLRHIPVYNEHRSRFGYEPIRIGIGVHTGAVMLGIIGHERFMQGTVISNAVNLASRLEQLTKLYGVSLVVSAQVLHGLQDPNRYQYRFLDNVKVKGKTESVPVYEVFSADPPALAEMKNRIRGKFERGVYEYHAARFAAAAALFEEISVPGAQDRPVEIYRMRCERSLKLGTAEPAGEDLA
jgi:class 3 adenylate cyclase/FixJ family two-component response regulator